jgi:hypothetical protein
MMITFPGRTNDETAARETFVMGILDDLDIAAHRIANAERAVPSVLDALNDRRAMVGTRAGNETGRGSGGVADPVASAAAELAGIEDARRRIIEAGQLVLRAIDHLDLMCRNALGNRRAAEDVSRCPGYPTGEECVDLTAHRIDPRTRDVILRPDRLCDRHGLEADRDERARVRAHAERMRRHNPKAHRE